ncbi:MAG: EMC3/TMCO1 family protein [Candidatus Micrarchaeota archaeon]
MVIETFTALVGFLALIYAGITKFVQGKLVDKSEMEAMQAESKRLNEEFQKAQKADDKKKMDRIMKEQMEFLPRMNTVMFKQFRPMFVILIIFAGFIWVVNEFDPFIKDDIRLNLTDDGQGCDRFPGDGTFTGCFRLDGTSFGKWTVKAKAIENGADVADNETFFIYNPTSDADRYTEQGKGEDMELSTDKQEYVSGETVVITAVPANMTKGSSFIIQLAAPRELDVDRVEATVSNGTYFRADLPLAIPLLEIKSIYQPYWWFIFISLIANLGLGFVMGQVKKKGKNGNNDKDGGEKKK